MNMQIHLVDPRDIAWEVTDPRYRVLFWRQYDPGNPQSGYASEAWELTGGDVTEVLEWADKHAAGRSFTVYAVFSDACALGSVQLAGMDPTETMTSPDGH
jgi:hypothetical protein